MHRFGFVVLLVWLAACSDGKKEQAPVEDDNSSFTYEGFAARFTAAKLPYQLTDTALLHRKDTATLRQADFQNFLPDTLRQQLLGSGKLRYSPLARIDGKETSYLIASASAGDKRVALLYVFDGQKKYRSVFPFLIPDSDPASNQSSSIDRQGAIIRSINKKLSNQSTADGRDVFLYTPETNSFTLIQTDPLDDRRDVINPIDTFRRTHPLAGDYIRNERNFVSVRDARVPNEINFFIHFEKGEDGDKCVGELKGTALLTSTKTAVYRQGGDPCVLELQFGASSVTLRETEGCGSHRDVKCVFEGTFSRKKAVSAKSGAKKKAKS